MNKIMIAIAITLLWVATGVAQGPTKHAITEVKQKTVVTAAPRECLQTFREFFKYVQKTQPDIVRDEAAQKRWLTQHLRTAFLTHIATFSSPADDPDFPSNSSFVGAWDYPTTYAIVSSRRYGKRAVIDVLFKWGPNTNYPSEERTSSFIFMLEDGAWKLDDIYTFRSEFSQTESLYQYFKAKR